MAETKSKKRKTYGIQINHNFCTGCGNCIEFCPQHVLVRDTKLNKRGIYAPVAAEPDKCTGCNLCEMYCGNFAIGVGEVPGEEEVER